MMSTPITTLLNVPGKVPILRAEATAGPAQWVAEHRDALRALVAKHGSLLVRGLGLHDVSEAELVFRRFGNLVSEREAFAPRYRYAEGVYAATKWPANQPMCMHHELSYALQPPSLMLFACLVAPSAGGETPLANPIRPPVTPARPAQPRAVEDPRCCTKGRASLGRGTLL